MSHHSPLVEQVAQREYTEFQASNMGHVTVEHSEAEQRPVETVDDIIDESQVNERSSLSSEATHTDEMDEEGAGLDTSTNTQRK